MSSVLNGGQKDMIKTIAIAYTQVATMLGLPEENQQSYQDFLNSELQELVGRLYSACENVAYEED